MRYGLIAVGIALVGVAVVLMLMARPNAGQGSGTPAPSLPGQAELISNSNAPSSHRDQTWNQFKISIEGKSYSVLINEYPQPVALQKAMEGFSPSKADRQSALGTLALTNHIGRHTNTKADLESYAHLFEDPAKTMSHYESLQAQVGGWDKLAARIREADIKNYISMQLVGEARVDDKHVFVFKMPATKPLFIVLRRKADGQYCHVNEWDESIRPLLYNSRILQLFKRTKDEP